VELAHGLRVPANLAGLPEGAEITLSVRPEQVSIAPGENEGLAGPIVEIIYVGTTTKILIETPCGRAQAWLPAQAEQAFAIGDRVALGWAADAATLHPRGTR
jgi:ABC-type Fe3+/spermidine/putrescine transport system ATPase subunit